jgi:hypothetical protein
VSQEDDEEFHRDDLRGVDSKEKPEPPWVGTAGTEEGVGEVIPSSSIIF